MRTPSHSSLLGLGKLGASSLRLCPASYSIRLESSASRGPGRFLRHPLSPEIDPRATYSTFPHRLRRQPQDDAGSDLSNSLPAHAVKPIERGPSWVGEKVAPV